MKKEPKLEFIPFVKNLNGFLKYVKDYYGPTGIHAKFFPPNGAQDHEIRAAVTEYIKMCTPETWGNGDSIDRENIKWIMMDKRRKNIEAEIKTLQEQAKCYPDPIPERTIESLIKKTMTP